MASTTYIFKRVAPGRYTAIDPTTDQAIGIVFGSSNDWRAQRLDGSTINNAYAIKQHAAAALKNSNR